MNSESPSHRHLMFGGILFIVLIITIINKSSSYNSLRNSDSITREDSRIVFELDDEKPNDTDLQIVSQYFIKDKLQSPSSVYFSTLDYDVNYVKKDKIYLIAGSVEAKNGSDVTIKRRYVLGLQYLGGNPLLKYNWKIDTFILASFNKK